MGQFHLIDIISVNSVCTVRFYDTSIAQADLIEILCSSNHNQSAVIKDKETQS